MPNRIVRDAILTSEAVSRLDWPEEVFYRRLMSVVDDYGRCEANPQLLRSRCYPLQVDKVRVADIARWMAACQKAGLIAHYEVSGKAYLQIEKFGQQQRSASKCPAPPGGADPLLANASKRQQPPADAPVFVFGDVSVDEDVGESVAEAPPPPSDPAPRPKRAARQCPAEFEVTAEMLGWAQREAPNVDLRRETDAFRDPTFQSSITDWPGAWRNWMRRAWVPSRSSNTQGKFSRSRNCRAKAALAVPIGLKSGLRFARP